MMISSVELVTLRHQPIIDAGVPSFEVAGDVMGVPRITGNYLIADGNKIRLVSPKGETMIIASPFRQDGRLLVHFAIGGLERRIAHTLTIDGLETIVTNLSTLLALAKLERDASKG